MHATPTPRRSPSRPGSGPAAGSRTTRALRERRLEFRRSSSSWSSPRPAIASTTRARWPSCSGISGSLHASPPGSRVGSTTASAASGTSATGTPTRGSRSGSRATAGCPSIRPPAAAISAAPTARPRSPSTRRAPGPCSPPAGLAAASADSLLRFQLARGQDTSSSATPRDLRPSGDQGGGGGGISRGAILALVLLGLAFALVLGKLVLRRSRYLTRDPRRLAGAYRQELVDFLADQRVDVPSSATLDELRELVVARTGVDARRFVETLGLARFGPVSAAAAAAQAGSGRAAPRPATPASVALGRRAAARRLLRSVAPRPSSGGDRDGGRRGPSPPAHHRAVAEARAADRRPAGRRRPSYTSSPKPGASGPGS